MTKNNNIGKKRKEEQGESGANTHHNQLSSACYIPFIIEGASSSTSKGSQGRGPLGYSGSSGTFGAKVKQTNGICDASQCNECGMQCIGHRLWTDD